MRRDVEASLTRSDNEAAARLWELVIAREGSADRAAASLTQVLRAGGDTRTQVSVVGWDWFSPYGQTLWGLEDQARFFRALLLGCVLPQPDTDWLVSVTGNVVPEQRWGLLAVDRAAGKGGWGPDPDGTYLVRQVAMLTAQDGNPYVAAVATRAAGTDFTGATRVLDDVVEWLEANVRDAPTPSTCDDLA